MKLRNPISQKEEPIQVVLRAIASNLNGNGGGEQIRAAANYIDKLEKEKAEQYKETQIVDKKYNSAKREMQAIKAPFRELENPSNFYAFFSKGFILLREADFAKMEKAYSEYKAGLGSQKEEQTLLKRREHLKNNTNKEI